MTSSSSDICSIFNELKIDVSITKARSTNSVPVSSLSSIETHSIASDEAHPNDSSSKCKFVNDEKFNFEKLIPDVEQNLCITSIIFYHFDNDKTFILVQKRSKVMSNANRICGPGGKVDPNETWATAIKREVFEESGIDMDQIDTTIWCVAHNLDGREVNTNREGRRVYNVVFAAEIPKDYSYVRPRDLDELDRNFVDLNQKIKNYHKWKDANELLTDRKYNLISFFRLHLKKFLRMVGDRKLGLEK
jgi:8-oxo-dGTP pyrophosphatase MutT (NUDIX family)